MYLKMYIYIYFFMIKKIVIIKSNIYIFRFYFFISNKFLENIINKIKFVTFIFHLTFLLIRKIIIKNK
jgi:hypothetical protein